MENRLVLWASGAEIVSSLAVVISLIFLIAEVNRNTEATLGDTSEHLLELLQQAESWAADPAFAELIVRAKDPDATFSPTEHEQYQRWIYLKWNACELALDRRKAELVSDDYWEAWDGGCRETLEPPLARQVWQEVRIRYGPGFRAYFDGAVASFIEQT